LEGPGDKKSLASANDEDSDNYCSYTYTVMSFDNSLITFFTSYLFIKMMQYMGLSSVDAILLQLDSNTAVVFAHTGYTKCVQA
jgi:hypothetical protein